MYLREYSLPRGWFSHDPKEAASAIEGYLKGISVPENKGLEGSLAAIAPHAGWHYSGKIAAKSFAFLDKSAQTVVVIGGHLPDGFPVLCAMEDAVRTPFGAFPIDIELRGLFLKEIDGLLGMDGDRYKDNTVEVLLPMARYFYPDAKLLWLRFPANINAFMAGKLLSKTAKILEKKIVVIGSTDLTHYGRNYGFLPRGTGAEALDWVRIVNDGNFIKAVKNGKPDQVLKRAEEDSSSCSAGAVLGVMGFSKTERLTGAHLLEYGTSADSDPLGIPDSFVGYASIGFY